jgi:hypothetical protein
MNIKYKYKYLNILKYIDNKPRRRHESTKEFS